MLAYRMDGCDGAMARLMRPTSADGKPLSSFVHVVPASVERYTPVAASLAARPSAAYSTSGSDGCITRSVAGAGPAAPAASVRVQVAPPSVLFHTPLSAATWSVAPATEPAVRGSSTMRAMRTPPLVAVLTSNTSAPSCVHVAPPSVERSTPQP